MSQASHASTPSPTAPALALPDSYWKGPHGELLRVVSVRDGQVQADGVGAWFSHSFPMPLTQLQSEWEQLPYTPCLGSDSYSLKTPDQRAYCRRARNHAGVCDHHPAYPLQAAARRAGLVPAGADEDRVHELVRRNCPPSVALEWSRDTRFLYERALEQLGVTRDHDDSSDSLRLAA